MAARYWVGLVRRSVLFGMLVAPAFAASDNWLRLSSAGFDVYSELNAKQSALLVNQLDSARLGLQQHGLSIGDTAEPVRVIAFSSPSAFARYRLGRYSTAFYVQSNPASYIVLGGASYEDTLPVVHEYVHHLIHNRYQHLPLWMDEGLADVYSTVSSSSRGVRVGLPPESKLEWLRFNGLRYSLAELFSVQPGAFDNVRHLASGSRFYAQSWLLVHMLRLSPDYERHFADLLQALESGRPAAQALHEIYGKSLEEISNDLHAYLLSPRMPTELTGSSSSAGVFPGHVMVRTDPAQVLADLRSALNRVNGNMPAAAPVAAEPLNTGEAGAN